MAAGKTSFLLYTDLIHTVSKLPDNKAGKLFKTILEYVNDLNPKVDELEILLQVAFEPVKNQLKRNLKNWEAKRSKLVEAGKKGGIKSGESRRSEATLNKASKNEANEAVNVLVSVNGSVRERENTDPLVLFSIEHCLTVAMNDERWVRVNKITATDLKEFNSMLERRGIYEKNPADYKNHFANWKAGGKKEEPGPVNTGTVYKTL